MSEVVDVREVVDARCASKLEERLLINRSSTCAIKRIFDSTNAPINIDIIKVIAKTTRITIERP